MGMERVVAFPGGLVPAWEAVQDLLALGRFLVMTAYRNGGTPTPGMRHLQHVIESLPGFVHGPEAALLAQAHFYLGLGYRTMGDESQAMACFNIALTHLPTFQPALLARQG